MEQRRNNNLQRHVIFCPKADRGNKDSGSEAEYRTIDFLVSNLRVQDVGDYRMLVNYNLPMQGADSREIDVVLIDKFGVFLLEVKGWLGYIVASSDAWIVDGKYKRDNALEAINAKARIFHTRIFGNRGELRDLHDVSVTGLVVLTHGRSRFKNSSDRDDKAVVGLSPRLLQVVSSTELLHHGFANRRLNDATIQQVTDVIFRRHQAKQKKLVEHYLILGELSFGDLFDAYEAQDIDISSRRVRLKRYQLVKLSLPEREADIRHFRRSAEAIFALGSHPNILNTYDFFADRERPDVFYEVTELISGEGGRLDEIMARARKSLTLEEQLDYLEPPCRALGFAHNRKGENGKDSPIYHRNLCPETIFVTRDKTIKLADFDFAKFVDTAYESIVVEGETLIEKPYTAPEVLENPSIASAASDIYALGVLWYFLACLPTQYPRFDPKHAEVSIDALQMPEAARALMKRMVASVPVNRPQTAEEVLKELQMLRESKQNSKS